MLDKAGTGQSALVGTPSGPGIAGHWFTDTPTMGPLDATHTSLDVSADGHYHYSFRFSEAGTFEAADGKWTRNRVGSMPVTGTYHLDGSDQVSRLPAAAALHGMGAGNMMEEGQTQIVTFARHGDVALEGRAHCLETSRPASRDRFIVLRSHHRVAARRRPILCWPIRKSRAAIAGWRWKTQIF